MSDVAASAAVALTSADQAGRILELTGPTSLTKIDQLATISNAVGRVIPLVEISPDEFRTDMAQFMPAAIVEKLLRYWAETVTEPEVPLPMPFDFPATPLAQWAIDNRTDFSS